MSAIANLAREDAAFLGVNLEGMAYDGWPIARFLERELDRPRLFEIRSQMESPGLTQVIWHRDAWQASLRPVILEKHIGASLQMRPDIQPGSRPPARGPHWPEGPGGLVDAAIVALAESIGVSRIATTDRRHFEPLATPLSLALLP